MNMIKTSLLTSSLYSYTLTFFILIILIIPFAGLVKVFAQDEVIDTITVGIDPRGVAYNPGNGNTYVTNSGSGTVSVIGTILPIANAGPDQTVESDDLVQLDGTGSSDNGGSPIVEYQWTQIDGPSVTLDNPNSATTTFTSPNTQDPVNLVFQLVVTNEKGVQSEPDTVTITVNPADMPPVLDGITGSGNNINIQVQRNTGNNAGGQSGNSYSDESIFQGQSGKQDSSVVS